MSTYRNNVLDYRKVENEACRDRWIEAMACGTPVIAFNQGAVPEVVKYGVINRAAVRANFEPLLGRRDGSKCVAPVPISDEVRASCGDHLWS